MQSSAPSDIAANQAAHDQQRNAIMRDIGTGFGSLAGASLLFLSGLANQIKHDLVTTVAIACFAVALPLLAFTAVAAYSLAPLATKHNVRLRRAIGTTTSFGLIGAAGVVGGITAMLWRLEMVVALAFAGCALVALATFLIFARQVAPPRQHHAA
jgi:cobalamin synthase